MYNSYGSSEIIMDHDEIDSSKLPLPVLGKPKPPTTEALSVITRFLLQKLFGPSSVGATSDHTILYLDLSSNMVGSFLMGWLGVVFKDDINHMSNHLAIGLSTGYLGSLTTFSGWNQKMVDLTVEGHWVFSILGFLISLFLAAYSLNFGIETAMGFKFLLTRKNTLNSTSEERSVDNRKCYLIVTATLLVMLIVLLSVSGTLLDKEFQINIGEPQLWLACIVAPPGVWIQWLLARFNGRGLGCAGILCHDPVYYAPQVPHPDALSEAHRVVVMTGVLTVQLRPA